MSHRAVSSQQLAMFLTPHEVANLRAGDFGDTPVSDGSSMRRRMAIRHMREEGGSPYRGDLPGVGPYVDRIKESVAKSGGINEPIHIWHGPQGPTLLDGHHRAVVAMETDRLVPAVHHDGERTDAADSAFLGPTAEKEIWSGDR